MKISKLFHWLYALVMLLPIFAIGTTCLYAIFNKNAYQSYSDEFVEETINLDSSNVNSIYVNGQHITYTFKEHNVQWNETFGFSDISIDLNQLFNTQTEWNRFYLYRDSQNIMFYTTNNQTYILSENDRQFDSFTYVVDLNLSNDKAIYDYGIAQVYTFVTNKVSDVFYYSVDKVTESPLFSWAYDSFLSVPFVYITNLFSIPSNSVIIELLSYWLAISIIWLVFDLIMYVPLLVHRWIDKGVIE